MADIYGFNLFNDSLDGTTGNDNFYSGTGSDQIFGTVGSDVINAGYAKSALYWRYAQFNDYDTVNYSNLYLSAGVAATAVHLTVDLQLGTVLKYGVANASLGVDTLIGVDRVDGTAGADTMSGRNFWDYEEFRGNGGNDYLNGRAGTDGANYANATAAINVNLAAGTVTGDASVGSDTLREIEQIIGTSFADTFVATGYGGSSVNKNSFGENFNLAQMLAGADTIVGNGDTIYRLEGSGGSLTVDLGLQTAPGVAAHVITNALTGVFSTTNNQYAPGDDLVSGASQVRASNYDDTLIGGGHVNTAGSINTVSGDASFEGFRGNGGNDSIDGKTGFDRADYVVGGQSQGIVVQLAAGIVTGDPLATGTDTLRGIESIGSTYMDDIYNATGFTLSNAGTPSVNRGDVIVTPPAGETLASNAFNEFRAYAGNDTVTGNGATRVSLSGMFVETLTGPAPSVVATFTAAGAGSIVYGQTDGGFGTVQFTGVFSVIGGAGNDSLTGSTGFQQLRGYYGNDTLSGGDGNDVLYGQSGGNGTDLNLSSVFTDNDSLLGGAGNDLLRGDFGNDFLDGGTGNDTMEGGTGNDNYIVDATTDVVTEAATGTTGGTDLVSSSVTWTLGANFENLTLTGSLAINGTGNELNNILVGNAFANNLNGGTGADTMTGGDGADIYTVDNVGDVVIETNATLAGGIDTLNAAITATLSANVENLRVTTGAAANGTGNSLDNIMYAGAGNNTLDGSGGTDTASYLYAGAGVTVSLAIVGAQATVGSGSDTLVSLENLTGSAFNDTLTGNSGANAINGGTGIDHMAGGDGSDTYTVDNVGDVVTETNAAVAGGIDLVNTSVSFTLGANVENLSIVAGGAVNGTGNTLANVLYAGAGNNVLDGGGNTDSVSYVFASAAVSASLAITVAQATGGSGTDTLVSIENLSGSAFNDTLTGNSGANTLVGDAGNDVLNGGLGNDILTGGLGSDNFLFASALNATTNKDTVSDFLSSADRMTFDNAVFTAVGADGALAASAFVIGTAAADAADRIIYDQASGQLYYDADGTGAGAKVLFGAVTAGTVIALGDLWVG